MGVRRGPSSRKLVSVTITDAAVENDRCTCTDLCLLVCSGLLYAGFLCANFFDNTSVDFRANIHI